MSIKDFIQKELDSAKRTLEYRKNEVEESNKRVFILEQLLEKLSEK